MKKADRPPVIPGNKISKKVGCRNRSIPATRPSFQDMRIEKLFPFQDQDGVPLS